MRKSLMVLNSNVIAQTNAFHLSILFCMQIIVQCASGNKFMRSSDKNIKT